MSSTKYYSLFISGRRFDNLTLTNVQSQLAADMHGTTQATLWAEGWPEWRSVLELMEEGFFLASAQAPRSMKDKIISRFTALETGIESGNLFRQAGSALLKTTAVLIGLAGLAFLFTDLIHLADLPKYSRLRGIAAALAPIILGIGSFFVMVMLLWRHGSRLSVDDGRFATMQVVASVWRGYADFALIFCGYIGIARILTVLVGGEESPRITPMIGGQLRGDYVDIFLSTGQESGTIFFTGIIVWFSGHLLADVLGAFRTMATK